MTSLTKQHGASEVHQLVALALIVLNIFITFGDVLLLSTTSYDELYYELIRLKDTFSQLEKYIEKAIRDDVSLKRFFIFIKRPGGLVKFIKHWKMCLNVY